MNFSDVAGGARMGGRSPAAGAVATPRGGLSRRMTAMAALALLAGCAGAPKPVVTPVSGAIEASPQLNPSVSRVPSPLLLRVYELKTAAAFNSADFMSLYQADQATLGADVVAREEMMLKPGQTVPIRKVLGAETRFIGVVGAYRSLERANWRAIVAVQPGKPQILTIRAAELAVSAEIKAP